MLSFIGINFEKQGSIALAILMNASYSFRIVYSLSDMLENHINHDPNLQ
jgi:hypothetical protein